MKTSTTYHSWHPNCLDGVEVRIKHYEQSIGFQVLPLIVVFRRSSEENVTA